jgi:hypothetical protein
MHLNEKMDMILYLQQKYEEKLIVLAIKSIYLLRFHSPTGKNSTHTQMIRPNWGKFDLHTDNPSLLK